MHNLNDMRLFAKVANVGSFTAAAEQLGVPISTLSRRVTQMEDELGVRLLERTTRSLRLTEAGGVYLNFCERIQAEAEQAEAAILNLVDEPRGLIRVSAPLDIGQGLLSPVLAGFLRSYPDIQVNCYFCNRRVELLDENFDVVIRVGALDETSLVAKRLGNTMPKLFSSRAYLDARGAPRTVEDLIKHDLLVMGDSAKNNRWRLSRPNKSVELPVTPIATLNDFAGLKELVVQGAGIALLPPYLCRDTDSDIQMVLPTWSAPAAPISALYPSHRGATPKLRAFIDFLGEAVKPLLN